jgi:uncharacterized membrane protein
MFVQLLLTALLFIIMDLIWFSFSLPMYNKSVASIQGVPIEMRVVGGIFAWLLLAFGIQYFVLNSSTSRGDAFLKGALFGFVVYGVYNGTNYAILKNYDMHTFMADLTWGTLVSGFVSAAMFGF